MADRVGVVMLVGAGDAIGAAVARRFAEGGYKVCIARRDAAKSQRLVDELMAGGQDVHAFSVDARQESEVQKLFGRVEQTSDRSRSASSMPAPTSTSRCSRPPKSCSSRHGSLPVTPASWSAARPRARCCRAAAAPSCSPAPPRASAAARALPRFRREVRPARRGASNGPRTGPKEHSRRAPADRRRRRQRGDPSAHEGRNRHRGQGHSAGQSDQDRSRSPKPIGSRISRARDGWTHELDLRPAVEKW